MASRDAILAHLAEYLAIERFRDHSPKGLQVEGRDEVRTVATGVSASLALFEKAREAGADMLLVHHGMFWRNEGPVVVAGPLARRLRVLLDAEMTLAGYHLPLDAHADVGNNALALRDWGATDLAPWGEDDGTTIGWRGSLFDSPSPDDLAARLAEYYGQDPLRLGAGPDRIRTVAVVSGAGQPFVRQAIRDRIDAFVTGEASEWVKHAAEEGGVHYFACGHHATERIGIRALGEHVARQFAVRHVFIDVPNPV